MITVSVGASIASLFVAKLISPTAETALLGLCPAQVASEYTEVRRVASSMFNSVSASSI